MRPALKSWSKYPTTVWQHQGIKISIFQLCFLQLTSYQTIVSNCLPGFTKSLGHELNTIASFYYSLHVKVIPTLVLPTDNNFLISHGILLVVSIGLFWFYFVSFSYNGVYSFNYFSLKHPEKLSDSNTLFLRI